MAIRLYENFRALLYVPFFAAHALDAYRAEGVTVELKASAEPGLGLKQILAGQAELTWGGPMRVLRTYDERGDCDLVCFGEVVGRDPFSLVGRAPRPDFTLADLARLRFASVAEVPTPWLCLQDDIRRAGLDPTALDRVGDRTMADNVAALKAGTIDAAQLFEPYVGQALADGGHVWYAAAARGVTAYTSFYTTRDLATRHRDDFRRMVRAIYRMQKWLHAQPAATIAATVAPYFPDLDARILASAIGRYQALGIWNRDPVLPPEGLARLEGAMLSAGFIKRGTAYARCVEPSFAAQAVTDDPPAL
jgi:NitT/TauT family transport system substrate-binding protein